MCFDFFVDYLCPTRESVNQTIVLRGRARTDEHCGHHLKNFPFYGFSFPVPVERVCAGNLPASIPPLLHFGLTSRFLFYVRPHPGLLPSSLLINSFF